MFRPGQHIIVHSTRVTFTDDGKLDYCPFDRPATFVGMASKPWYPGACVVDYGNGPRKSDIAHCRALRRRERIRPYMRALAHGLQAGHW